MTIVSPADNLEASAVIQQAVHYPHPLYIRYGKKSLMDIHQSNQSFEIGKAITVQEGEDVTLIATGETVPRAVLAGKILKERGINPTIISMHTIKPFDLITFHQSIKNSKCLITLEEHSIYGGLGEQCASIIAQENLKIKLKILGIPDEYMVNGSQSDVLDYYGMSPEKIADTAQHLLK
jgi:transketolase